MNRNWVVALAFLSALILLGSGCKHEIINPAGINNPVVLPPGSTEVCFESELLPLFQTTCAHDSKCHASGAKEGSLYTYQDIRKFEDGEGIVPYNSSKSEIYEQIYNNKMPQGGTPWTDSTKALLKRWIEEGARETIGCTACDTTKFTYDITGKTGVKRIMDKYCGSNSSCHQSATSTNRNINLSDYAGVKAAAVSGRLMPSIDWTGPYKMPKSGTKLGSCEITIISKWMKANYPQ